MVGGGGQGPAPQRERGLFLLPLHRIEELVVGLRAT